jgi:hypothetical protein
VGSKLYFAFFIACAGGDGHLPRGAGDDLSFCSPTSAFVWPRSGSAIHGPPPNSCRAFFAAFYMISDRAPDSRIGRILFAIIVAAGAAYVQFGLYRTNGLLWSLALCSIFTPLIDRLLPGTKYEWTSPSSSKQLKGEIRESNNPIPGHTAYPVR